jgi:beta-glucosidase
MQSKSHIDWTPLVLAISGDQTQHLIWRLSHGELTDTVAKNPQALYVVLIGVNNLGSGELPGPTANGVLAVADYLVQRVSGTILMLKVLPCGHGPTWLPRLCPPRCDTDGQPYTSFLPAVDKVNKAVQLGIDDRYEQSPQLKTKLFLLDCGKAFLQNVPNGEQVNVALMSDRLHPNAAGHRVLADCIESWIEEHIK